MKSEMKQITNTSGSMKPYIIGFILSLLLTFAMYFLVVNNLATGLILLISLIVLALIQLLVQLFCFLHLGQEEKPRWHLVFFISTVGIIFIVFVGSIWIMHHLNYNMMPEHMEEFIIQDEGVTLPKQ